MIVMCMSAPDVKIPEAPEPQKTLEERKSRIRSISDKRRLAAGGGIQSTILTGSGATGKTLLGQ
jgi:hypothetical protein